MPITKTKKSVKPVAKKPAPKTAKKVTIDDVWAIIADIGKAQKELQRTVGDLGNRFGDIAEQTLIPALVDKFEKFGFSCRQLSHNVKWKLREHNLLMELDALLENGTQAIVVEVKSKLNRGDIDEQVSRMEKVRQLADLRNDTRQFFCAMATMTADDKVIEYARANGFYIVRPSGEDVIITKPSCEPKFW